jgi:hypothetical protein
MVAERKVIDVETVVSSDALLSELERHPEGMEVRRDGRRLGMLTLSRPADEPTPSPSADSDRTNWSPEDWERERDRLLAAIPVLGSDGTPLALRPMTPERIERIVDIVGSLQGLVDTEQMHQIVEDGRQTSIRLQHEAEQAEDGIAGW